MAWFKLPKSSFKVLAVCSACWTSEVVWALLIFCLAISFWPSDKLGNLAICWSACSLAFSKLLSPFNPVCAFSIAWERSLTVVKSALLPFVASVTAWPFLIALSKVDFLSRSASSYATVPWVASPLVIACFRVPMARSNVLASCFAWFMVFKSVALSIAASAACFWARFKCVKFSIVALAPLRSIFT